MTATVISKLPDELQILIDNHIKGFNTHDHGLFLSVFADTAIIIDGIAPYRWLNPHAPANWLADVEKWHETFNVTDEHLDYEMGIWSVDGLSAYAVISGTLSVTMTGQQSITRNGHMTYTFANRNGVWKIEAQAWARIT